MTKAAATDKCRICTKTFSPHYMGEKNGYRLLACKSCGSVLAEPWVTPDDREKFLAEIEPQITHVPNPESEIASLKSRLQKIAAPGPDRKFLDVGCRNGYAVMAARELGYVTKGIDPHTFFIEFAKSKYDPDLFEQTDVIAHAASGQQADVVFARETFCEQTDPESFADALSRLVSPGGVLYIEEPDANSFNTPRVFTNWPVVFPPMNFAYYSKTGLSALLERHGFRVQKIFFSWSPVIRMIAVRS